MCLSVLCVCSCTSVIVKTNISFRLQREGIIESVLASELHALLIMARLT